MKLTILSPIKAYLSDYSDDELFSLKKALTYTNTSVSHLIKRHYNNHFWKSRNPDTWQSHLEGLQKELKKTLIFDDGDGKPYIRPGSIPYLTGFYSQLENWIQYPKTKPISWKNPLPFTLHPYQEESWTKLLQERIGNVSLCTGAGKGAIILKLCREIGLSSCIMVPSKSIFEELVAKFEYHFGKKYVGYLGNGKKKLGKLFTIAIADSIVNIVDPNSEEFIFFSNLNVLCADESHTLPSETLEKVCHGVLSSIPYRFFFSGTQLRNDGSGPLLQSIIGKTVHSLTTEDAVKQGFISPHEYRIISMESSNPSFDSSDALALKREHFLKNRNIAHFIARLANGMALAQGKQTLVLCEELSQLSMLAPLLKVPYALAHSEKRAGRLTELGLEKVDVAESIEKFNKNEAKVLIGTSCISTGTNIYPCHSTVNWVGGSSPIKTKQGAIGRSVRFGHSNPWASKCIDKTNSVIYDFDVPNHAMERHLAARLECYRESGTEIKHIRLKS